MVVFDKNLQRIKTKNRPNVVPKMYAGAQVLALGVLFDVIPDTSLTISQYLLTQCINFSASNVPLNKIRRPGFVLLTLSVLKSIINAVKAANIRQQKSGCEFYSWEFQSLFFGMIQRNQNLQHMQ